MGGNYAPRKSAFNGDVVRGLRRRHPDLDLVRVQDVGLRTAEDPIILEWAASEGRILLTHDRGTMPDFAYQRVRSGQSMPGVFVMRNKPPLGNMIEEILLVALCSSAEEWKDRVEFLPS
jgi:predicted nuclease of predicted toxin-antitoxin system